MNNSIKLESNDQKTEDCEPETYVFERVRDLVKINDTENHSWKSLECLNRLHSGCLSICDGVGEKNLWNVIQRKGKVSKDELSHRVCRVSRILVHQFHNKEWCRPKNDRQEWIKHQLNLI